MADTSYKTRPLTADDLERVVDIDAKYVGRRREGFYRKRLEAALADPGGFAYLGCDLNGSLQGFLLAHFQEGEYGTEGRMASLDAIGIDPQSAGKGMGRGLLEALDEILRHKGIELCLFAGRMAQSADAQILRRHRLFSGATVYSRKRRRLSR